MKFTKITARKILGFFVCVIVGHVSTTAFAADYYVSNTGSATWPNCTNINTPCSLQTSGANAIAGDTVYLRGGTYTLPFVDGSGVNYWRAGFSPSNSGTSGNPITFMAYPGETVFLDNSANAGQTNVVASYGAYNVNYIVFDGIDTDSVASSSGNAIGAYLHGSTGSTIKNADIKGVSTGDSNSNCIRLENADYHSVYNNVLHDSTGTNNSTGITSYTSTYGNIYNNTVYNCTQGIYDKTGGEHTRYHHNFLRDNFIGFAVAKAAGGPAPHDLKYYNNIVVNGNDIGFWDNSGGGPAHDIDVYNNSFYGNTRYGIIISPSGGYNYEIFNNNSVNHSIANFKIPSGVASYFDDNSTVDNFVNSGGTSPEDYKRSSYPTDGRGGSYPAVIGAYITGNEVIGYNSDGSTSDGDTTPPPPIGTPQGFNIETGQ